MRTVRVFPSPWHQDLPSVRFMPYTKLLYTTNGHKVYDWIHSSFTWINAYNNFSTHLHTYINTTLSKQMDTTADNTHDINKDDFILVIVDEISKINAEHLDYIQNHISTHNITSTVLTSSLQMHLMASNSHQLTTPALLNQTNDRASNHQPTQWYSIF